MDLCSYTSKLPLPGPRGYSQSDTDTRSCAQGEVPDPDLLSTSLICAPHPPPKTQRNEGPSRRFKACWKQAIRVSEV